MENEKTIEVTIVQVDFNMEVTTMTTKVSTVTDHRQLLMEVNEAFGLEPDTDLDFINLVVWRPHVVMFELSTDRGHLSYLQVIW